MKALRLTHKWIGLACGVFLFVLCASGAIVAVGNIAGTHGPLFGWCMRLHRSLLLGEAGHYIVGVATLLCVAAIVSGYVLWGAMARRSGLARSLRWTFPSRLAGLHNGAGVWAGIPLLLMALTGMTWSFGWHDMFDFHTLIVLHTGSWLGIASRLLWIAACVLGATLSVTGLIITLRRGS